MATKKDSRSAAKIIQDINELMGMVNVDGAWYVSMEAYYEIQAERNAKAAKKAQQATVLPVQKPMKK